jgi:hypothetical protein
VRRSVPFAFVFFASASLAIGQTTPTTPLIPSFGTAVEVDRRADS